MHWRAEDGSARGSPRRALVRGRRRGDILASPPVRTRENENECENEKTNAFVCDALFAMDDHMRSVVSDLRRAAESEGTTHWGDADRVDVSKTLERLVGFVLQRVRSGKQTRRARRRAVRRGGRARDVPGSALAPRDVRGHARARGVWVVHTRTGTCLPETETTRAMTKTPSRNRSRNLSTKRGSREDTSPSVGSSSRTWKPPPTRETTTRKKTKRRARVAALAASPAPRAAGPLAVPDLCLGRLRAANAWLGTANTTTHLHTDDAENLLCQVAGHKLARLFPPSCARAGCTPKKKAGERLGQRVLAGGLRARRRNGVPGVRGSAKTRRSGRARAGRDAVHSARVVALRARAAEPSFSVNFWF